MLVGITVALAFAAALVYLPAMHGLFGTEALPLGQLAIVAPFPFIVWGADEIRRALARRRLVRSGRCRDTRDRRDGRGHTHAGSARGGYQHGLIDRGDDHDRAARQAQAVARHRVHGVRRLARLARWPG